MRRSGIIRERRIPSDKSAELAQVLASLIDFSQITRIVEVGCGRGRLAIRLAGLVGAHGHVVGLDASKEVLGLAARDARAARVSNLTFEVGDARDLRLPDGAADLVICSSLLCSLKEVDAVVREMLRITRKGGVLVIAEPGGEQLCHDPDSRRFTYLSAKLNGAFVRGWWRRAVDQHVGLRVPGILLRHGVKEIAAEVVCQVFLMSDPRRTLEDVEGQLKTESTGLPESTMALVSRGGMKRKEVEQHQAMARRRLAGLKSSPKGVRQSGYVRVTSPLLVYAGRVPE